jgi:hypothetical protein
MPKSVTVDFWDVLDMEDHHFDLLPVIKEAGEASLEDRMKKRWAGQIDFLAEALPKPASASGTAVLIRTENWPGRVNTGTGALNALSLAPNEEVREDMSFYFDKKLKTLATQRQQFFRASRLVNLLQDITGVKFILQPKLRKDAWQRFQRMSRIGKIEIKVHGPLHHPELSRTVPSMAQLLDEAKNETNALEVGLTLSMGRTSQSLDKQIMRRVVNVFRRNDNAKSLAVSGNESDGTSETVDFINDRLVFSGTVEYAEKHLDRECRQLLTEAIEIHRSYLASLP